MKLPRRQFLHLAAGAAALLAVSRFAWAQAYPTRPVRIIVGFSADRHPYAPDRSMAVGEARSAIRDREPTWGGQPTRSTPKWVVKAKTIRLSDGDQAAPHVNGLRKRA
jgi:hypothetical protein